LRSESSHTLRVQEAWGCTRPLQLHMICKLYLNSTLLKKNKQIKFTAVNLATVDSDNNDKLTTWILWVHVVKHQPQEVICWVGENNINVKVCT
jgi:hypothetical protein